jgi:hypothetical protein
MNTKQQFGVTPNSEPETEAEIRAVETFTALEKEEKDFKPGIEFGRAMIALRAEIKTSGDRNWIERLEQLGISYEKARYWIAVVEGRPTQRGKAKKQEPAFDWDIAADQLAELKNRIWSLKQSKPVNEGSNIVASLISLADLLGYELKSKGGDNA